MDYNIAPNAAKIIARVTVTYLQNGLKRSRFKADVMHSTPLYYECCLLHMQELG
jgi:hypothetical protein